MEVYGKLYYVSRLNRVTHYVLKYLITYEIIIPPISLLTFIVF